LTTGTGSAYDAIDLLILTGLNYNTDESYAQEITKDFIILVTYLLPGFLAAWVFYGLTSPPKPSQFERVVGIKRTSIHHHQT